jgi:hypothetical protein
MLKTASSTTASPHANTYTRANAQHVVELVDSDEEAQDWGLDVFSRHGDDARDAYGAGFDNGNAYGAGFDNCYVWVSVGGSVWGSGWTHTHACVRVW